jgi:isoamylase
MALIHSLMLLRNLKGITVHVPQPRVGRAVEAVLRREGRRVYLILNAFWQPLDFEVPPTSDGVPWRRWIDTALESPEDIVPWETAPPLASQTYRAAARSVVMLFGAIGRGKTSQ